MDQQPLKPKESSKQQETWWWIRHYAFVVVLLLAACATTYCAVRWVEKLAAPEVQPSPPAAAQTPPASASSPLNDSADLWQTMLEATALLIGGVWALWIFVINRSNESALKIETTPLTVTRPSSRTVVFFEVTLENSGKVKIGSKPRNYDSSKKLLAAYSDPDYEILDFSVSLLVRPLPKAGYSQTETKDLGKRDKQLDWFSDMDKQKLKPTDLVAEIDLVDSYAVDDKKANFWMEPGETYHLPVALELQPGDYLGMITFIGERGDFEFWRRFILLQVPFPKTEKA
jgi:hypothetical protein